MTLAPIGASVNAMFTDTLLIAAILITTGLWQWNVRVLRARLDRLENEGRPAIFVPFVPGVAQVDPIDTANDYHRDGAS